MIKFENTDVVGLEHAVRGMRNLTNSCDEMDGGYCETHEPAPCSLCPYVHICHCTARDIETNYIIGPKDLDLIKQFYKAGTDYRKFMRMIVVYVDITAPLYWWKEFDMYKVVTVANSCNIMNGIRTKEFTLEDFSCEKLQSESLHALVYDIEKLNYLRDKYDFFEEEKALEIRGGYIFKSKKEILWQMIRLLPNNYNQKRTIMLNYEVLANIYKSKKNHELDEWNRKDYLSKEDLSYENTFYKHAGFCDWIETLPYSELITGKENIR